MTLNEADQISDFVINLVASKPRKGFCRTSQLRGRSMCEISNAFALATAKRRQISSYDPALREKCKEFADKAGALVASLKMVFIPDTDAEKLNQLPHDSTEYKKVFSQLMIRQLDDSDPESQQFLKLETLDSFNNYCWTLDASDPLYWQKIYTHLGLPYDETCPSGEPDMTHSDDGKLVWKVKSVKDKRKTPLYQVLLWIGGAIALAWFLITH